TKKTTLRRGVKALHLSYLGDAEIGAEANVGAGVITCNYDGEKKHRTTVGAGAFLGSDSQLVAPVTVGEGAYVGAGSTITQDVPPGLRRSRPVGAGERGGWGGEGKEKDGGTGGRGAGVIGSLSPAPPPPRVPASDPDGRIASDHYRG